MHAQGTRRGCGKCCCSARLTEAASRRRTESGAYMSPQCRHESPTWTSSTGYKAWFEGLLSACCRYGHSATATDLVLRRGRPRRDLGARINSRCAMHATSQPVVAALCTIAVRPAPWAASALALC